MAPATSVCDLCGAPLLGSGEGARRCPSCGLVGRARSATAGPGPRTREPEPRLPPLGAVSGPDRFERTEIDPRSLPPPEGGYVDLFQGDDEIVPPPRDAPVPVAGAVAPRREPRPSAALAAAVAAAHARAPSLTPVPPRATAASARASSPRSLLSPRLEALRSALPRLGFAVPLATFAAGALVAAAIVVAVRSRPAEPSPPAPAVRGVSAAAAAPAPRPPAAAPEEAAAPAARVAPAAAPPAKERRRAAATDRPRPQRARDLRGGLEPAFAEHGVQAPRPIEIASAAPALPPPAPQAAPAAAPSVVEDAPAYAGEGFRKPVAADRGCVQRGLRLPRDLTSRPWVVTARFPVGADGTLGAIEVLGDVADPRVAEAVRRAIRGCAFVPGADAQGRPTRLWAVMPIRFVGR